VTFLRVELSHPTTLNVQTNLTKREVIAFNAKDDREIKDSAKSVKLNVIDFEEAIIAVEDNVEVELLI
jgi:hypothetical protein